MACSLLPLAGVRMASAQTQGVRARITEAVDETNLVRLRGNVHPLARAEFDQGVVADSQPMNRMLLLLQRSPEQQAALSALMEEQLTKSSPNFHKWLTPEEFGKQFGPSDEDIQAVTAWLGSHGFQGIKMGPGHMVIEFTGTVGHVRNAFHTEMHRYLVKEETHIANASDPQIPAALAPVVAGIRSLHNFKPKSHRRIAGVFRRDKNTGRVEPLFTAQGCGTGGSQPCFALGPADFAKIYGVPNGLVTTSQPKVDGTGQTVAIVADSNINQSDQLAFRNLFGFPSNILTVLLNGPDPGLNGDEGEADLDVQWSGAVAPGAMIDLVVSEGTASTLGIDLSALYIVENNLAPVMSESFGICEAQLGSAGSAFYNTLWEQAAAQGITVMVSAGDAGSAGCDDFTTATVARGGIAVSGIASTPFNVAVGGTDFDDIGKQLTFFKPSSGNDPVTLESALGYIPETTWNDSCAATAATGSLATCVNPADSTTLNIVGGSGGHSAVNAKPPWQNGGTPNDNMRDVPDVSLFASDGPKSASFYVVCEADAVQTPSSSCSSSGSFEFVGVGGTSSSSPAFAGIMALINQKIGQRQGNVNPILYQLAKTQIASATSAACNSSNHTNPSVPPPAACVFNDITKGNNSVPCAGTSPNCSSSTANTNGVLVDSKNVPAFTTGPGYDLATGLGSVNVGNLLTAWTGFEAGLKPTSITLASQPAILTNLVHGTQVSFIIKVTGTGIPTGEASVLANFNPTPSVSSTFGVDAAALDSTGSATIQTSGLLGGTYSVFARYPGDTTFGPSDSSTISVVVKPEQSQLKAAILSFNASGNLASVGPPSVVYGSSYIFRVEVAGVTTPACEPILFAPSNRNTSGCATGFVTITDNGSSLPPNGGNFALNSLGHTENQPIQLSAGKHTLMATYFGDSSYIAPASPASAAVMVTQAGTTTAVTASPSSITSGATVTLTATVSTQSSGDAPGAPGGVLQSTPVQFLNGSTLITGTITLKPTPGPSVNASLTATLTTTISALGLPERPLPWRPRVTTGAYWVLAACAALYAVFLWKTPSPRRRGYAYAGLVLFALTVAGIVGCGGGGKSTPPARTVTITAKFAGDTNYTASSGATTVSVQ